MKRIILLPILIFLGHCSHKISMTQKSATQMPNEMNNAQKKCADLDSLLSRSWKLADAAQAAYFRFYERNDSLVNLYLMGEFKPCLMGLPRKSIEEKFGTPSFSDSNNIYYEFLSRDRSRPMCLKFWVVADSVQSIKYQLCEGY